MPDGRWRYGQAAGHKPEIPGSISNAPRHDSPAMRERGLVQQLRIRHRHADIEAERIENVTPARRSFGHLLEIPGGNQLMPVFRSPVLVASKRQQSLGQLPEMIGINRLRDHFSSLLLPGHRRRGGTWTRNLRCPRRFTDALGWYVRRSFRFLAATSNQQQSTVECTNPEFHRERFSAGGHPASQPQHWCEGVKSGASAPQKRSSRSLGEDSQARFRLLPRLVSRIPHLVSSEQSSRATAFRSEGPAPCASIA